MQVDRLTLNILTNVSKHEPRIVEQSLQYIHKPS